MDALLFKSWEVMFQHEQETRAVLIIDVFNPSLTMEEQILLKRLCVSTIDFKMGVLTCPVGFLSLKKGSSRLLRGSNHLHSTA